MRIIGLEEHVVVPELLKGWSRLPGIQQTPELGFGDEPLAQKLRDVGQQRLAEMDDQGVNVQVLSLTTPGVQNLAAADAVIIAREANEALLDIVHRNPRRFQAFAALPTQEPDAAATELERAISNPYFRGAMIYGRTGTVNADAQQFDNLYGMAERLKAPLYLHPQTPVDPVRQAYYSGFSDEIDVMFAKFGLGWYYETGIQVLRMILSGTFDRHPNLQVIVGHWGEVVLFVLEHMAMMQKMGLHLDRPIIDYFRQNVWVTGSGLLSERYLRWTAEIVGVDRIMYATDYPFMDTNGGKARAFLSGAPISEEEKAAIGSGNWARLTANLPSAA